MTTKTHITILRGMVEWREGQLARSWKPTNSTEAGRIESWVDQLAALKYAVGIIEQFTRGPGGMEPPQGRWSDHHAAIHTDCEWDWTAVVAAEVRRGQDANR